MILLLFGLSAFFFLLGLPVLSIGLALLATGIALTRISRKDAQ